jgi:hypothetical protein
LVTEATARAEHQALTPADRAPAPAVGAPATADRASVVEQPLIFRSPANSSTLFP